MDKQQTARWNRQLKIKQVRQAYAAVPVGALVARVFARHDELLATADALMTSPAGRTLGATIQKSAQQKQAIALALPLANALHLLYLEAEDAEKAHALRRTKTDYTSLPAALILAETRNVAQQARAHAQQLATEANLDATDLDQLDAANAAFAAGLTAPQVARETGKTRNTTLDAALRAADVFVKAELAPAVETLKLKQPEYYAALQQAMRIDDAPGARSTATPPAPGQPASPAS